MHLATKSLNLGVNFNIFTVLPTLKVLISGMILCFIASIIEVVGKFISCFHLKRVAVGKTLFTNDSSVNVCSLATTYMFRAKME